MIDKNLCDVYLDYLDCLNRQDWVQLASFVSDTVSYNGKEIGLSQYREMLVRDFRDIPDLHFHSKLLIADRFHVAARLEYDCTPEGEFLGLPLNGKRVSFSENVFYEFYEGKIAQVWSVIDKAALEAQLTQQT